MKKHDISPLRWLEPIPLPPSEAVTGMHATDAASSAGANAPADISAAHEAEVHEELETAIEELEGRLDELETELSSLEAEEPDYEFGDAHYEWEDRMDELAAEIEDVQDELDDLQAGLDASDDV